MITTNTRTKDPVSSQFVDFGKGKQKIWSAV